MMSFLLNKLINLIIGGLICIIAGERSSVRLAEEPFPAEMKGYRDVLFYNGKFLAVGSDGRIDLFNKSGEKSPVVAGNGSGLHCIVTYGDMLVAAGEKGTILYSGDGKMFEKAESGTERDINGLAAGRNLFIAGADNGILLLSGNGISWNIVRPGVKGNIVSVTAGSSSFYGVTDAGEIIRSGDGFNWQVIDYNTKYSGYNKPCMFRKILTGNNRVFICGKHYDGSPAVLFSAMGNVWTERILNYQDEQGMISFLTSEPNSMTYDPVRDQFILGCNDGEIFSLPSCTKCNASARVSGNDIYAITCTDDLLLCAGEGFSLNILYF
jgi:hypothetical protein